MTEKHDYSLMALHKGDLFAILALYTVLLLLSVYALCIEIINSINNVQFDAKSTIYTILSSSLCGSAIFYSRKAYKAAINRSYKFLENNEITPERIGTIAFFLLRPLFGVAFALVTYSIWKASVSATVTGGTSPSDIIFVTIPIGFFSGFSAGKIIEQFEERKVRHPINMEAE